MEATKSCTGITVRSLRQLAGAVFGHYVVHWHVDDYRHQYRADQVKRSRDREVPRAGLRPAGIRHDQLGNAQSGGAEEDGQEERVENRALMACMAAMPSAAGRRPNASMTATEKAKNTPAINVQLAAAATWIVRTMASGIGCPPRISDQQIQVLSGSLDERDDDTSCRPWP